MMRFVINLFSSTMASGLMWCDVFLILRDETNDEDGNNDTLSLLELMIHKMKKIIQKKRREASF